MVLPKFVPAPKFEDYKEEFKDYLIMERKNGIILVRLHTNGGPVKWNYSFHNALARAWEVIGSDLENEVMILTSTGPFWISDNDEVTHEEVFEARGDQEYNLRYHDCTKLVENLIFDIDFPTIAAVNGPGFHDEIPLLCDITLCTEDTLFQDHHFFIGVVPGDGNFLAFQGLLGAKRAAYCMYTNKAIDAKTALEWGLVNEIVPRERLVERARELAEMIMKQPRTIRRMTSQLVKRPWKRLLVDDFQVHTAHEFYGAQLERKSGTFKSVEETWKTR